MVPWRVRENIVHYFCDRGVRTGDRRTPGRGGSFNLTFVVPWTGSGRGRFENLTQIVRWWRRVSALLNGLNDLDVTPYPSAANFIRLLINLSLSLSLSLSVCFRSGAARVPFYVSLLILPLERIDAATAGKSGVRRATQPIMVSWQRPIMGVPISTPLSLLSLFVGDAPRLQPGDLLCLRFDRRTFPFRFSAFSFSSPSSSFFSRFYSAVRLVWFLSTQWRNEIILVCSFISSV